MPVSPLTTGPVSAARGPTRRALASAPSMRPISASSAAGCSSPAATSSSEAAESRARGALPASTAAAWYRARVPGASSIGRPPRSSARQWSGASRAGSASIAISAPRRSGADSAPARAWNGCRQPRLAPVGRSAASAPMPRLALQWTTARPLRSGPDSTTEAATPAMAASGTVRRVRSAALTAASAVGAGRAPTRAARTAARPASRLATATTERPAEVRAMARAPPARPAPTTAMVAGQAGCAGAAAASGAGAPDGTARGAAISPRGAVTVSVTSGSKRAGCARPAPRHALRLEAPVGVPGHATFRRGWGRC